MKTQINCTSRLEVLNAIRKLEKYNIEFIENEDGVLADIDNEKAWSIGF